jgi:hypothetical protein
MKFNGNIGDAHVLIKCVQLHPTLWFPNMRTRLACCSWGRDSVGDRCVHDASHNIRGQAHLDVNSSARCIRLPTFGLFVSRSRQRCSALIQLGHGLVMHGNWQATSLLRSLHSNPGTGNSSNAHSIREQTAQYIAPMLRQGCSRHQYRPVPIHHAYAASCAECRRADHSRLLPNRPCKPAHSAPWRCVPL